MDIYPHVIINPESNSFQKARRYFESQKISYTTIKKKELLYDFLEEKVNSGIFDFLVCGGDGTINNFINAYMGLSPHDRTRVNAGFLPGGKANDLLRALNFPLELDSAMRQILKRRKKQIDLIRVNDSYFITGGGLGLPSETIKEVISIPTKGMLGKFNTKLKDFIYSIIIIKKMIFGYAGLEKIKINNNPIHENKLMAITVLNQPFIGRRFRLAPDAKNDDGIFELCIIEKPKNSLSDLYLFHKIMTGQHLNIKGISQKRAKEITISFENPYHFMADGELLCCSNRFKIEIVPKAISVFY